MIKSILEQKGLKVGLIGGVAIYIGKEKLEDADRTTPESITIQEYFAKMRDAKVDVVVMEVSSQALKLDRVTGCNFDLCLFTNFSEDHISPKEHPDMEDYFNSKLKIFDICSNGYLNSDDEKVATILDINKSVNIKTYGINTTSNVKALPDSIEYTNTYVSFDLALNENISNIKVYVPGKFSIYNALAAICASSTFDISFDNIQKGFDTLQVPGRSELVPNSMGVAIIIDYAHSPASLENILTAVKGYVKGNPETIDGVREGYEIFDDQDEAQLYIKAQKTYSTTTSSETATANTAKEGNGYAKITYVGDDQATCTNGQTWTFDYIEGKKNY